MFNIEQYITIKRARARKKERERVKVENYYVT